MKVRVGGMDLVARVREYCRQENMIGMNEGIVVGLSGGADSVCLLLLLLRLRDELGLRLTAVHVHHGIRGETADRDRRFAEAFCESRGLLCRTVFADVPAMAAREHLTIEEAGRKVRYQAFEEAAKEFHCGVIAVAHHMDDQAETVLMNLLRGSGLRGCGAIAPVRRQGGLRIIRPLLCLRRQELEAWLREQGISWCDDETNAGTEYLRSRIRNCLVPELQENYNERAVEHLNEAAASIREADAYLEKQAAVWLEGHVSGSSGQGSGESEACICLPAAALREEPAILQSYIVRRAVGELGGGLKDITRRHIQAILQLLPAGRGHRKLVLPQGLTAQISYDRLLLGRRRGDVRKTGRNPGLAGGSLPVSFTIFQNNHKKTPQNCCVNWFDYDTIKGSLLMRTRRPGDRICIHADGSTQKLSDYMINARIPAEDRSGLPVLADGDEIIWVPGYRMAENRKVTEATKTVLQVSLGAAGDALTEQGDA